MNNLINIQCQDPINVLRNMGYKLGKTIGEGTYSKVCTAVSISRGIPEKVACKIIRKKYAGSDFIKKFLPRELEIVKSIKHPNIISIINVIELNHVIYIFMDYCRNGDLLEYIRNHGPLSEEKGKNYFRQIINAVEYLHDLNIAHRDLKCENILITLRDTLKLGDFGFSRRCVDKETGNVILSDTFCGSAAYAAPEILQGISYDPKMYDMWALGCILYIMLSAAMPFDDTNITKMLKCQLNRTVCFASLIYTSNKSGQQLKSLLCFLLEPNVEKRANIKEVSNCLWLQDHIQNKCKRFLFSMSNSSLFKF